VLSRAIESLSKVRVGLRTPWVRTVVILWLAQVASELGFGFSLPFGPLFIQELGVDDLTEVGIWAGVMAAAFSLSMGAMGPVWGVVADRFGYRLMIQRALFGAAVMTAGLALVHTPEQMLALRVLHGAFTGVVVAISTLTSLITPRQYLATVLGAMNSAFFLGGFLGPVLGGAFADAFGLRAAFVASGAILAIVGVLVTVFVPERRRERPRAGSSSATSGGTLMRRDLWLAMGLMAIVRFANMAPQPILPLFVQELMGTAEGVATMVGLVVAASGMASTLSALLAGRLADRYGRRATILACMLAATVISPLHALVTSVWALLVLRMAMGLALGGTTPATQALVTDITPPGRRGAAFGLMSTMNSAGGGAGPVFGGVIAAAAGVPAMFVATAPIFAAGAWMVTRIPARAAR
jgi:DHA1 family multidrug resistance protein-like MFS transporter